MREDVATVAANWKLNATPVTDMIHIGANAPPFVGVPHVGFAGDGPHQAVIQIAMSSIKRLRAAHRAPARHNLLRSGCC
ncbi:MAG: hypothetical protein APF80_14170 [Alphaproteobacteria bacterium BRH_c36]|nr:MAG: hypothetical protein APF80_14170 [Alphaproteobacteria bacterium BRH_c36]